MDKDICDTCLSACHEHNKATMYESLLICDYCVKSGVLNDNATDEWHQVYKENATDEWHQVYKENLVYLREKLGDNWWQCKTEEIYEVMSMKETEYLLKDKSLSGIIK